MKTVSFPKHAKDIAILKIDLKNLFKDLFMQSFDLRISFSIYLSLLVLPGTLIFSVSSNSDFLVYCAVV